MVAYKQTTTNESYFRMTIICVCTHKKAKYKEQLRDS
jgi:hypothetical protein